MDLYEYWITIDKNFSPAELKKGKRLLFKYCWRQMCLGPVFEIFTVLFVYSPTLDYNLMIVRTIYKKWHCLSEQEKRCICAVLHSWDKRNGITEIIKNIKQK